MKHITLIVLLSGFSMLNSISASASIFHKWVDANGITHYSDEAPDVDVNVSRVELEPRKPVQTLQSSDYYSIQNQWARVNKARLDLKKSEDNSLQLAQLYQPKKTRVKNKAATVQKRKRNRNQSRRYRHSLQAGFGSHRKGLFVKKHFPRYRFKRKLFKR